MLPEVLRSGTAEGAGSETAETQPSSLTARRFFRRHCQSCHDKDGSGSGHRQTLPALPDFRNSRWQQNRSDRQLLVSILDGKGTRMPSFAGRLSREEARDLVALIRSFGPKTADATGNTDADFRREFRRLQEEFRRLCEQLREISSGGKSSD
jgi:mono/diheme cytochrome c family protein